MYLLPFKLILIVFSRTHGLSGVPTHLQYLRQEVGLSGEPWDNLGKEWCSLASLWLRAETLLLKSAQSDQTFTEIHKSNIPEAWKDWMCSKNMKTDSLKPADSFRHIFTQYLNGLLTGVLKPRGIIMQQMWCCPGKMEHLDFFYVSSGKHSILVSDQSGTTTLIVLNKFLMQLYRSHPCRHLHIPITIL